MTSSTKPFLIAIAFHVQTHLNFVITFQVQTWLLKTKQTSILTNVMSFHIRSICKATIIRFANQRAIWVNLKKTDQCHHFLIRKGEKKKRWKRENSLMRECYLNQEYVEIIHQLNILLTTKPRPNSRQHSLVGNYICNRLCMSAQRVPDNIWFVFLNFTCDFPGRQTPANKNILIAINEPTESHCFLFTHRCGRFHPRKHVFLTVCTQLQPVLK